MSKTVLILTHARDDTANMVISHLQNMSCPFVRFNTEEFQKKVGLKIYLGSGGNLQGTYIFPERKLYFNEIGAVWNRRVRNPLPPPELQYEPDFADWAVQEIKHALYNSFTLIEAPIVNPWETNERIRFNKLIQMRRATELGFETPKTCVASDPNDVSEFVRGVGGNAIIKKIRKGMFTLSDGRRFLLHTVRITEKDLAPENLRRMRFFPLFLQENIEKKFDIRSVVVGNRVFSFAIHSQETKEGKVDFRTAAMLGRDMRHERIELGDNINSCLVEYTHSFGLSFGAIDLILTPDDKLVFLEDNPNGQWAWLEEATGAPIAHAFAEHLANISSS